MKEDVNINEILSVLIKSNLTKEEAVDALAYAKMIVLAKSCPECGQEIHYEKEKHCFACGERLVINDLEEV